jgi:elongation factor G
MSKKLEFLRNIGISAHIDSGKTTLTERILFYAGRIHKISEVRGDGDGAKMDHMELEKERGITITSAATRVKWKEFDINIIDTPGHVDFTVEVERSLRVLDGAILVLDSVAGVQAQSITVDRQMKRYRVPRVAFVNKMDKTGADPYKVCEAIRDKLKLNARMAQIPVGAGDEYSGQIDLVTMKYSRTEGGNGEKLISEDIPAEYQAKAEEYREYLMEELASIELKNDEAFSEDYLEGNDISVERIHAAIKEGIQTLQFVPVYNGSAFHNKGVQNILDAVIRYLPSPLEAEKTKATSVDKGEEISLVPDDKMNLAALAFKITEDQYGQLTYTRIYQGALKKGDTIVNARTGKRVRVGRMVRMHSDEREPLEAAYAGDIIALVGVDCASGDTFCNESHVLSCESMHVPDPVIKVKLKPKDNDSQMKVSKALSRFMREDPTFRVETNEETSETEISGMGELHLEIYVERIKREYGAEVEIGEPSVAYRETIQSPSDFDYTHKKQTGGAGQYGCVVGNLRPLTDEETDAGENFIFENKIKGGNIPSEYIPACEAGFKEVMEFGPLAGYPMLGFHVTLVDGKYHDVDSSDLAFKLAARGAMRQAIAKASPQLLEPMMKVEVETPTEFQGSVIGDLSSRRGIIQGTDALGADTIVTALVPLSEMFGYSTTLRSMSQGKANFSMEFEKYMIAPSNVQQDIMKNHSRKRGGASSDDE